MADEFSPMKIELKWAKEMALQDQKRREQEEQAKRQTTERLETENKTEAEKAYAEAERLIFSNIQSSSKTIVFKNSIFRHLRKIPLNIVQLKDVQAINIGGTQIDDISLLSGLTKLTQLRAKSTPISDLRPLSSLKRLTHLRLDRTPIADISPLANLENLVYLRLDRTTIENIDALKALRSLRTLGLEGTQILNIEHLSELFGLTSLNLKNTEVLDLRPLRFVVNLATNPSGGLRFSGSAATRLDPRIAEISLIKNHAERARTLFDYLETWTPPGEAAPKPEQQTPKPSPPAAQPAPIRPAIEDGRMVLSAPPNLPEHHAMDRAEMGWDALKAYRESFGDSFNVHNYAPLPNFLAAFDEAMGDAFDPKRLVKIGMMGSRIVNLSRDTGFCEMLPTGAEVDLKGFAAQIATFVNRFPDWVAYQEEAERAPTTAAEIVEAEEDFAALGQELSEQEAVDKELAEAYAGSLNEAKGDDTIATGHVASTRETARVLSEVAVEEVKSGALVRKGVENMDKVADGEFAKLKFWSGGWTLVVLKRQQVPLRRLAKKFPAKLGWLDAVLDYCVGPEDKT